MPAKTKESSTPTTPPLLVKDGNGTVHDLGRERVTEIQRARILTAMVEESAKHGASNVTVAHIVARAGVSRRTFYELFTDREDCFIGTFDEAIARASRHILDDYDPAAKWLERVRTGLTNTLSFLEADPSTGQLLIVGSLGAGAKARERRGQVVVKILALIDEGREQSRAGVSLSPLTAEGIVGGVLSVLHARLLDSGEGERDASGDLSSLGQGLLALTGPLMSMIVLPYLGPAAARKELARPVPKPANPLEPASADPLRDVDMRLTYRTMRVLTAVGAHPGSSNREVGLTADMQDQGQISKLLTRLARLGLIENGPGGLARGTPNAWVLTVKGREIERAIGQGAST